MSKAVNLERLELPAATRAYVADALAWDRSVAKLERAVYGERSPLQAILDTIQLGVLGTGCRGTRGVGRARAQVDNLEAAAQADPVGTARYQRLRGADLATTDAVLADGRGDVVVELAVGLRTVEASLPARVGLVLARPKLQLAWLKKIAEGDSRPALVGAEDLATAALVAAATAWWRPIG